MFIKLQITQDDINKGKRFDCSLCPIARAAKRYFNEMVNVSPQSIFVGNNCYRILRTGENFILDFDGGVPVEPIEIEIEQI